MQESEGVLYMRVSFRIALAGQVIGVSALYEQTRTFCKNYLTDAPASFEVAVTPADIAFEREKNDREAAVEGHAPGNFSDEYLETLALYRKIVERLLEWDTLLFHGSCISVDSKAYLFTAKSGTGKSTHTQLWKKRFGERAVFINDDKPLLKISAQGVTVYGTPWDGKHHRSTNTSCPLKAVCILTRNTENSIQRIDKKAALPMLCQQSYRPFMTLADDRKAADELRYVDLNSAFQAVADQNATQQERQESYEKYEAEQEKRIQELEEKISEIYSRWDEY